MNKLNNLQKGAVQTLILVFVVLLVVFIAANYFVTYLPQYAVQTQEEEIVVEDLEIKTLSQGVNSIYSEEGALLITNQDDLETLWNQTTQGTAPIVDFSERTVLATFFGTQPTGGYSIRIDGAQRRNEELSVDLIKVSPGSNCFVTQAETNPYHIVSIDGTGYEVVFNTEEKLSECN